MKTLIVFMVLVAGTAFGQVTEYNSSPYNYRNSPYNYENSPYRYENSPYNYDNSPMKYGNERIIRDENGNAAGYVVPKKDGGANFFDLDGNRKGYLPAR